MSHARIPIFLVPSVLLLLAACGGQDDGRPTPPDLGGLDAEREPDLGPEPVDLGGGLDQGPELSAETVRCEWLLPAEAGPPVRGVLDVTVRCQHPEGLQGVQFLMDGVPFDQVDAAVAEDRYESWFDTEALADGPHELRAVGFSRDGARGTATRTVQVDNTPPSVVVSSPSAGSLHIEWLTVSFDFADAGGLASARFSLFAPDEPLHAHQEAPVPDESPWLEGSFAGRADIGAALTGDYEVLIEVSDLAGNLASLAVPFRLVTTPRFRAARPRSTEQTSQTADLALGDLDGDGVLDLALATSRSVFGLTGRGDGTFASPVLLLEQNVSRMIAHDLDGDGVVELVVVGADRDGMFLAVLQRRDGSWQRVERHALVAQATALALGHLDGDGRVDVVVGSSDDQRSLQALLSRAGGPPFFEDTVHVTGGIAQVTQVVIARVDPQDEWGDVVVGQRANRFSVFPGNGDGSFDAPRNTYICTVDSAVAVGELREDGVNDIAAISGSGYLKVFAGEEDDAEPYQFGDEDWTLNAYSHAGASGVLMADLDGDGHQDLLTVHENMRTVAVWLGNGAGELRKVHLFNVGPRPGRPQLGDLNGDGLPDLVLANQGARAYTVLLNRGGGSFDAAPELLLDVTTEPSPPAPLDLLVGDFVAVPGAPIRPELLVTSARWTPPGSSDTEARLWAFESDGHMPRLPPLSGQVSLAGGPDWDGLGNVKDVRAADLDGDGSLDLVLATDTSVTSERKRSLVIALGPFRMAGGVVDFAGQLVVALGSAVQSLAACDLDGDADGLPELALVAREHWLGGTKVPPLLSLWDVGRTGDELSFSLRAEAVLTGDPAEIQCGLVNEDAANDFLVVNESTQDLNYFKGSWAPEGLYGQRESLGVGADPRRTVIADVDGDGASDAVVSVDGAVAVLFGTGSDAAATFASSLFLDPQGRDPYGVAVRDFNFDGLPDIAVADYAEGKLSVFVNTGDRRFSLPPVDFHTSLRPTELVSADFNGDGCDDLAVLTTQGRTVTLLLSEGPRCTPTP